ncbi:hypothetical protein JKP88DRAFT_247944 [Tribonema minus]|uniref:SAP domain-containing protein n=1 Tax=Tribonema minus TaxID=303371 RepID=A0A835YNX5_9STRA|nr:hypothetical protein JKP88DRAFT_247944 [Tribonema minus]
MSVLQLRRTLRALGIPTAGLRPVLASRLQQHCNMWNTITKSIAIVICNGMNAGPAVSIAADQAFKLTEELEDVLIANLTHELAPGATYKAAGAIGGVTLTVPPDTFQGKSEELQPLRLSAPITVRYAPELIGLVTADGHIVLPLVVQGPGDVIVPDGDEPLLLRVECNDADTYMYTRPTPVGDQQPEPWAPFPSSCQRMITAEDGSGVIVAVEGIVRHFSQVMVAQKVAKKVAGCKQVAEIAYPRGWFPISKPRAAVGNMSTKHVAVVYWPATVQNTRSTRGVDAGVSAPYVTLSVHSREERVVYQLGICGCPYDLGPYDKNQKPMSEFEYQHLNGAQVACAVYTVDEKAKPEPSTMVLWYTAVLKRGQMSIVLDDRITDKPRAGGRVARFSTDPTDDTCRRFRIGDPVKALEEYIFGTTRAAPAI